MMLVLPTQATSRKLESCTANCRVMLPVVKDSTYRVARIRETMTSYDKEHYHTCIMPLAVPIMARRASPRRF